MLFKLKPKHGTYTKLLFEAQNTVAKELGIGCAKVAFLQCWDEACDKDNLQSNKTEQRIGDKVKAKMAELAKTKREFYKYQSLFQNSADTTAVNIAANTAPNAPLNKDDFI